MFHNVKQFSLLVSRYIKNLIFRPMFFCIAALQKDGSYQAIDSIVISLPKI
jgi:hypothetical protein